MSLPGERKEIEISYRERGSGGTPLLLVHGAGTSSLYFDELHNLLSQKRRTVAIDLPGHGKSGPLPLDVAQASMPTAGGPALPTAGGPAGLLAHYRDTTAALAERLGLGRFVLAGHSMGGAVAQLFAAAYPDRLAGLVLIATGARLRVGPQVFDVLEHRFAEVSQLLALSAYSPATDRALAARWAALHVQCTQEVMLADFRACHTFDERAALARLEMPTLIVGGADDWFTPPKLQQELAAGIRSARLQLLPRAGHAVPQERPDEVARLIGESPLPPAG